MKIWTRGPALISTPLTGDCGALVILPVRNEERFVARALNALVRQVDLQCKPLSPGAYEIIVLLNNCTDGSQKEVEAFTKANSRVPIHVVALELPPDKANIGYVRRLLMDEACRRFLKVARNGAILSTDADTVVSSTWIGTQQAGPGERMGRSWRQDPAR